MLTTSQQVDRGPVRLGVIGLGVMGATALTVAREIPDTVVTAAADVDPDAVERLRPAHPGIRFTTDPADLLAADDLDAVYIATPPAHHAELVTASLARGVAVFCEKPLAIDLADGRRMLGAARAGSVPAFVNFALSDRHAVLAMERALDAGEVGEVLGIDVRLQFARWPRRFQAHAGWLATRAQGGFVREVFSHFAYLTDRLVGPIQPVDVRTAHLEGTGEAAEVSAHGLLRAAGVPVHLSAVSGVAVPGGLDERCEWIMWGTRRSYLLRDWDQLFTSQGEDWTPVRLADDRGSELSRFTRFAAAVRGEPVRHLADFAAAYRVQAAVEAFHHHEPPGIRSLQGDMRMDEPPRLAPLLAQYDHAMERLLLRLSGPAVDSGDGEFVAVPAMTDEEYFWEPVHDCWSVRRGEGRWVRDEERTSGNPTPFTTIAWRLTHLSEMLALRADWTIGSHSLTADRHPLSGDAAGAIAALEQAASAWRAALVSADDAALDEVGRCTYPDGSDPEEPFIHVAWWVNQEVLHHGAEIALLRDLYRARSHDGSPEAAAAAPTVTAGR